MGKEANISRAIARSRRARRALERRRRRAALAAGALVAAAVPLSFSLMGVTGNELVQAAVTQANSLSDLLDGRSPGARTAARLTKTKHAQPPAIGRTARIAPPEHLGLTPPATDRGAFGDISQLLIGPPSIDIAPPANEIAVGAPPLSAIIGGSGGGSGGSSSAGGGGGGGGAATFPAAEPHETVPVSAVPEPGTWTTMLLGFALLGWRLRRRPSSGRKAVA